RLQDVWIGSFKLRVNKSRFHRNEESIRRDSDDESRRRDFQTQKVQLLSREEGEGSVQLGRTFKTAMVNTKGVQEVRENPAIDPKEVLHVEVDGMVLKELKRSFVGVLAVNVEGEMEALCKAKTEWLCYYFKEVRPWSPSNFADRRVTWVKIFGIPLYVWGENLFKAVGGKYGEFLDFDENTASRSKLDVAKIKISTCFRGCVDDLLKIKALGVVYTIWVLEDKGFHPTFVNGSRCEEQEYSWVESTNFPAEAMVVGRQFDGGSVEEGMEEDR
ncbi:RNA recognition motif, partial [Trifolium medium]|nr:RNA recognition motif [Trifolium medium]